MQFRNWKYEAVAFIREFAAKRNPVWFTADDLRAYAWRVEFVAPDDDRWWGQALQEARDLGIIRVSSLPGRSIKRRHKTTLWLVNA